MKMQSNFTVNDTTTVENSTVTVIFYTPIVNENVTANDTSSMAMQTPSWLAAGRVQIPLYAVIFLLAVIGNSLVILTLVQNKRMRTITNVFLLNLAVSDLLLGVLCMPFTLVGTLLRDFVFGELMCKFLPFLQGHHKCREHWPDDAKDYERMYNLFLDVFLFVLPLLVLGITYSLITRTLWQGMRTERNLKNNQNSENQSTNNLVEVYIDAQGTPASRCPSSCRYQSSRDSVSWTQLRNHWSQESTRSRMAVGSVRKYAPGLRRSNAEKSLLNKKRVIQMLFVVVLEFFICWTPLYVINTMVLFEPGIVYNNLTSTEISFFHLLAYTSSCCNPITYCFMNRGFRKAFLNLFRCFKRLREPRRISLGGGGMGFGGGIGGPDQRSEAETTKLHNNHRLCTDSSY
ncbi:cholecystokinin receptor-like isoform X2 [Phlebotomus papatasi]|uniref:cholecystokinin receptor-like isoform X2 n=1 Tax=Phlebotomus papatasi TaxID=29031 RepID=UPI00248344D3|nr:cholecystokinin receptor-like isoform X2 [Phlebotomus papatasi]